MSTAATRSRNRARKEGRHVKVTNSGNGTDQLASSHLSNKQHGATTLQQGSSSNILEPFPFFTAVTTTTRVTRSRRSNAVPSTSAIVPEVAAPPAAGPSTLMPFVQKRASSYGSEDPSSKKRRASRRGSTSQSERGSVPASAESSDDEDSQLIENMLIRIPRNSSPPKTSRTSLEHDDDEATKAAASLLAAIATPPSSSSFSLPRVNDQYATEAEFMRHVKGFTEQTGHRAYQLGGQGKYFCRVLCRNWKKKEYTPPGLACPFHFLASKTKSSSVFTIISAEPNHNEACKTREGSTDMKVYETSRNSNSKKGAKPKKETNPLPSLVAETQHIPYADHRRPERPVMIRKRQLKNP